MENKMYSNIEQNYCVDEDKENLAHNECRSNINAASNNVFKLMVESLMNELPSKDALQQFLGNDERGAITNAHSKIVKETSFYISCYENQLSSILACKRYESGHTVSNLSSFTLSYARAFYANSLACLQTEIKNSDHKKEWEEIGNNFRKEAAKKYVDYLHSQTNVLKDKRNDADIDSSVSVQDQEIQGDDVNNNIVSYDCNTQRPTKIDFQSDVTLPSSLTPNVKENAPFIAMNSTPNFDLATPSIGKIPRKMKKNIKSPAVTPVVLKTSHDPGTLVVNRQTDTFKQFGKKKLNFYGNFYCGEIAVLQPTAQKLRKTRCPKRRPYSTVKRDISEKKELSKKIMKKESRRGKKMFVSTLTKDTAQEKHFVSKKDGSEVNVNQSDISESCISSVIVTSLSACSVDTPVKRKEKTFTSPQSPPRKRLIFSPSPRKLDLFGLVAQNRVQKDWKLSLDHVKDHYSMTKDSSNMKILKITSPSVAGQSSLMTFLASNVGKKMNSSNDETRPSCAKKSLVGEVMSPIPCMPVPSLWAPRKAKRTPLKYRLSLCRRSLVRQFQGLSVNHHQFMDTPPGSPGRVEPLLPLLD